MTEHSALIELDRMRFQLRLRRYDDAFATAERLLDACPTQRVLEGFISALSPQSPSDATPGAALRALRAYSSRNPSSPWPYYLAVDALDKARRPLEALELSSPLCGFPRRYGWMRWKRGMLWLNERQDYAKAEAEFRASLASRPTMWQAHGHLAEIALCRGQRRRAFELIDSARCESPWDEAGRSTWRGELRLWLGQYRLALRELERGRRGGALFAPCWLGAARLQLGQTRAALELLDEARRIDPGDGEALVWLGEAKRRLGRFDEALEHLQGLRGRFNIWAAVNRALIFESTGRLDELRAELRSLPRGFLDFFRGKLRVPAKPSRDESRRLLEEALRWARGLRRSDRYLFPIWMRLPARRALRYLDGD